MIDQTALFILGLFAFCGGLIDAAVGGVEPPPHFLDMYIKLLLSGNF